MRKVIEAMYERVEAEIPPDHTHFAYRISFEKIKMVPSEVPCMDGGKPADASTAFRPGSPICISVPRMMQIPPESLEAQFYALLIHELAHQYGADEDTAVKIQKALLHRRLLMEMDIKTQYISEGTSDMAGTLESMMVEGLLISAM